MIKMSGSHGMSYVSMTMRMMQQFGVGIERTLTGAYRRRHDNGYEAREYDIEPDVSAACYFYALSPLLRVNVKVKGVYMDCLQGDIKFLKVLVRMGCRIESEEDGVQLENEENNEKRRSKEIAVLVIADGFAPDLGGRGRVSGNLLHPSTPLRFFPWNHPARGGTHTG